MQPSRQFIQELEKRIQEGACTPEENNIFQQWVMQLDVSDPEVHTSPDLLRLFKTRMYQQLMQEMQGARVPVRKIPFFKKYKVAVAAAAILIAVCSGALLWYAGALQPASGKQSVPLLTVIDNTHNNAVRKVTMPDGTVIWLNRHSSLAFDQHQYNTEKLFVRLAGEGYFDVAKDSMRPFIVETGHLYTKVLGTAFNIEAYGHESEIRVSLVHGRVAMEDRHTAASLVLAPEQTMRYSRQTGKWMVVPMAVSNIDQWTTGGLVFNEVPLEEALLRIADKYNLTIEFDKKIVQRKRITASFTASNWQSAMNNILFVHGLSFDNTRGNVVIIH